MILLYGCFAPWGMCCSVDAWMTARRSVGLGRAADENLPPPVPSPPAGRGLGDGLRKPLGKFSSAARPERPTCPLSAAWPVRMMQVHVALIYVISVPYKLAQDPDWFTGDALHWTIASDTWWIRGLLPELTYCWNGVVRKILTWGTIAVEGAFPLLVCFSRTRVWAVAAITSLHLGIALLIPNVTFFTLAMVCTFWVYLPAPLLRRVGHRFRKTAFGKRSRATLATRLVKVALVSCLAALFA